jgi:hypothetical protein
MRQSREGERPAETGQRKPVHSEYAMLSNLCSPGIQDYFDKARDPDEQPHQTDGAYYVDIPPWLAITFIYT